VTSCCLATSVPDFAGSDKRFLTFRRCVPDNQRTYALGLQWLFLCMFGSMPGPVIFGAFIDKTCILWEETCSGRGSCLEYNNELLSYLLVAAGLFFQSKTLSLFWPSGLPLLTLKKLRVPIKSVQSITGYCLRARIRNVATTTQTIHTDLYSCHCGNLERTNLAN